MSDTISKSCLHLDISTEGFKQFSLKFYGTSMEIQELHLVLTNELKPSDIYQQNVLQAIQNLFDSLVGDIEFHYVLELGND